MSNPLLVAALSYAARGWHVFPLHTMTSTGCSCGKDCGDNAAKHPRYHDGDLAHGHNSATTDAELITRWWTRWPDANIGIVTGAVSGFVVIDIDPRNGGDLTVDDLEAEHGKFPETVESLTGGGGRHLLYQYPGKDLRCGTEALGSGVDIKADGGYIVAPPSLHASGRRYEWEASSHPDDIPLAAIPEWIPLEDDTEENPETGKRRSMDDYTGNRPGDDFNRRVTREEVRLLLANHGWVVVEHRSDVDYLRRPGKTRGAYSASLGYLKGNRLKVFTTSDPILRPKKGGYQPFALYALLDHGGNFTAATKVLAELGYGRNGQPENDQDTPEAKSDERHDGEMPGQQTPSMPVIELSTNMTVIVNQLERAIRDHPKGPFLYQRAHQLSMIIQGAKSPKWLNRAPDAPLIHPADKARIRELASLSANWLKWDGRKKTRVTILPPPWAIDTLMARPRWIFPPLEGIICAPTLRPDGSVLDAPGYDQDTGLYLHLDHVQFPAIPVHPTLDDVRVCIEHLYDVFTDFPFLAAYHKSAAVAAILSLVARFTIQGKVPFFAVRSTTRGAGKGLLIDAISVIATGRQAPRWAQTLDEEEERKRLMTIAMAGDATLHIDNISHPLGSGPLDMVLTAEAITERVMATHAERTAPIKAVFFGSGNNMVFQGDMARRVVPIDLAPVQERPDERDGFQHHPLLDWVLQKRPALVVAALTIVKAYIEAGKPQQSNIKPFGSYEPWSDLIRQSLIWAGQADPCAGRGEIEAESDPKYEMQRMVLNAWHERYLEAPKTLKEVVDDIDNHTVRELDDEDKPTGRWIIDPLVRDLHAALVNVDRRGKTIDIRAIQYAFRSWVGRVLGELQLQKAGQDRLGAVQWCVKKISI